MSQKLEIPVLGGLIDILVIGFALAFQKLLTFTFGAVVCASSIFSDVRALDFAASLSVSSRNRSLALSQSAENVYEWNGKSSGVRVISAFANAPKSPLVTCWNRTNTPYPCPRTGFGTHRKRAFDISENSLFDFL